MSFAVRCLFAISDNEREKLHQVLDAQAKTINDAETQRFITRWGFDPVKGQPVDGSAFEYTKLDAKYVPAVYTSGYKRRPSRPVSIQRVRSPCQMRNSVSSPTSPIARPTKRRLRFDANDENRETFPSLVPSKMFRSSSSESIVEGISAFSPTVSSSSLSSPPASLQSSPVVHHYPSSPLVLSSSCPPALSSDSLEDRLCGATSVDLDVPGLSRSLSESSFSCLELSPSTQAREYVTPSVRTASHSNLVQRVMTDYASIRKKRTSSKPSPRT